MKGTITKIHEMKHSRNGNLFFRVEFKLDNGDWAKSDICPDFRNYQRWADLLKVGMALDDLDLRRPGEVNADSYPRAILAPKTGRWIDTGNGMRFELDRSFADGVSDMIANLPDRTSNAFQPKLFKA